MKRLILILTMVGVGALAAAAMAGDYHTGGSLICTDCHIMHASQAHQYGDAINGGTAIGDTAGINRLDLAGGKNNVPTTPVARLLRGPVNELCLSCHDGKSWAPDVYGVDNAAGYSTTRMAGGLNKDAAATGLPAPGNGFGPATGHSLGYSGAIPGDSAGVILAKYPWAAGEGLECTNCHAQHGGTTYRNLLNRGMFTGKTVAYNVTLTPTTARADTFDVFEGLATGSDHYATSNVNFGEPNQTKSAYANWCKSCHNQFHGTSGDINTVGGNSGGWETVPLSAGSNWVRHPNADVDIGAFNSAPSKSTFVSSLAQFNSGRDADHRVKVMDVNALWTGASPSDTTITASCFSCHKAHGNENPFGLIFLPATGTISDNGVDHKVYKDLCKNCHVQG